MYIYHSIFGRKFVFSLATLAKFCHKFCTNFNSGSNFFSYATQAKDCPKLCNNSIFEGFFLCYTCKSFLWVLYQLHFWWKVFFPYATHAKVCHTFCTNSIFGRKFFFYSTQAKVFQMIECNKIPYYIWNLWTHYVQGVQTRSERN